MRRASIVLIATLLAAACGTQPARPAGTNPAPVPPAPGASASTADTLGPGARHNDADVAFVRRLIPHHRAGITLAGAAAAKEPKARTLAQAIIVTQQDEIVRMTGWLSAWGATPPASAAPALPAGDPIRALIGHQDEAVTIAQQEQANGGNRTALDFAEQIIESRTAQTTELKGYLG